MIDYERERWGAGEVAHFEYRCWESHDSGDAELWYRSHQTVTVLGEGDHDGGGMTLAERRECGQPVCYEVRWADGFAGTATEDELLTDPAGYIRPAPPEVRAG